MKRLAIFVEGETEQLFAAFLVREMANAAHLHVEFRAAKGGKSTRRRNRIVTAVADNPTMKWYVLIVDCSGDGGVKSRILEEFTHLAEHDYKFVIGLRDAPKNRADIPRLREGLAINLPAAPPPVHFVLAVMEIEAWFLAEHTHLPKIHDKLTCAFIHTELGFDPSADDMRNRDRPAQDLNAAYKLVGARYQKGRAAERTIYLLDCSRIVFEMVEGEPDIKRFVETISAFLEPENGGAEAGGQAPLGEQSESGR